MNTDKHRWDADKINKKSASRFLLKSCLFFLFLAFLFISCTDKKIIRREAKTRELGMYALQYINYIQNQKARALDEYINSLTEQERLCQLFVLNLEGSEKFWFVERTGKNNKPLIPGGYIFFGFNIARAPDGLAAFTDSVKTFSRQNNCIMPFLCLDAEGGYVNRLRGIAGPLPENARVAQCLNVEQAEELYSLNAVQLKALGFDLNLAPVAEAVTAENEKFLDGRSFGDSKKSAEYSRAAVRAYQKNKVGAVAKHFPGNNDVDPHAALPRLFFTENELEENVIAPFEAVVQGSPAGVLMSHALVDTGNSNRQQATVPASLSAYWIDEILRGRLGFKGIVFSDDIFMAALEKNGFPPSRAVHTAILAGVNCILMSEKRFINEYNIVKNFYATDEAFKARADDSIRRVVQFKIDCGIIKCQATVTGNGQQECAPLTFLVVPADVTFSREERLRAFYAARAQNIEFYQKYFLPSASREEQRALRVD